MTKTITRGTQREVKIWDEGDELIIQEKVGGIYESVRLSIEELRKAVSLFEYAIYKKRPQAK